MEHGDKTQIAESVRRIIGELAQIQIAEIKGNDRLREDLGLDSLQNMELLSRVSEEFSIDPDMDKVMAVVTVDDVSNALAEYFGKA